MLWAFLVSKGKKWSRLDSAQSASRYLRSFLEMLLDILPSRVSPLTLAKNKVQTRVAICRHRGALAPVVHVQAHFPNWHSSRAFAPIWPSRNRLCHPLARPADPVCARSAPKFCRVDLGPLPASAASFHPVCREGARGVCLQEDEAQYFVGCYYCCEGPGDPSASLL